MKVFKKLLKIIFAIICWIIGLCLLYETIHSFEEIDPWGLGFTFYTLPIGALSMLCLRQAIVLTKKLIKKN